MLSRTVYNFDPWTYIQGSRRKIVFFPNPLQPILRLHIAAGIFKVINSYQVLTSKRWQNTANSCKKTLFFLNTLYTLMPRDLAHGLKMLVEW